MLRPGEGAQVGHVHTSEPRQMNERKKTHRQTEEAPARLAANVMANRQSRTASAKVPARQSEPADPRYRQ